MKKVATKITVLLIVVLLLSAGIISANKNSKRPFYIEGTWNGKLGMTAHEPDKYFGLVLEPKGILKRVNTAGNTTAVGTWQTEGKKFSGSYRFLDDSSLLVKVAGSINAGTQSIEGNWNNDGDNYGMWYITKLPQ